MVKGRNVDFRRERVIKFMLIGMNNTQIAEKTGVSEKQIRNDIKAIAVKNRELMKGEEKGKDIILEMFNQNKEIFTKMWRMHISENSSEKAKIQSLKVILDTEEKQLKFLERLGMVSPEIPSQNNNIIGENINIIQILENIAEKKRQLDEPTV